MAVNEADSLSSTVWDHHDRQAVYLQFYDPTMTWARLRLKNENAEHVACLAALSKVLPSVYHDNSHGRLP
jgi:hypothetical protein